MVGRSLVVVSVGCKLFENECEAEKWEEADQTLCASFPEDPKCQSINQLSVMILVQQTQSINQ